MASVEDYLRARREREAARDTAQQMADTLGEIAVAFDEDWARISMLNVDPDKGFALEKARDPTAPTFDAREWLTAQEIAKVLTDYHAADQKVHHLWKHLEKGQRQELSPPEDQPT